NAVAVRVSAGTRRRVHRGDRIEIESTEAIEAETLAAALDADVAHGVQTHLRQIEAGASGPGGRHELIDRNADQALDRGRRRNQRTRRVGSEHGIDSRAAGKVWRLADRARKRSEADAIGAH